MASNVKKLKFGRAAGRDAIPPEMLKLAIDGIDPTLFWRYRGKKWTGGIFTPQLPG